MARKSTTRLSSDAKREEMSRLEKELLRSGFRPPMWKRVLRGLVQLIVLAGILGLFGWGVKFIWSEYISNYDGLVAKYVEFRSNGVISKKEILNLMRIQGAESLVSLDVQELEAKLMNCPSIRKASITRELPSTLIVEIDARLPVAWLDCPQVGVRAGDVERGCFVDSEGVVFPCFANIHSPYLHSPVLQIPAPASGELNPGDVPELSKNAVTLLVLLKREEAEIGSKVRMISIQNEWSYNVEFASDTHAVFGIYELGRQVENLILILQHAKRIGKKIQHVNLVPERNIPVTYHEKKGEDDSVQAIEDGKMEEQEGKTRNLDSGKTPSKPKEKAASRSSSSEKRSKR